MVGPEFPEPDLGETLEAIGEAQGGLAALFHLHRADLLRFLAARCGDRAEADDHLQDLWIKVMAAPHRPTANGRAYLFRMANNLVIDGLRSKRRAMVRDGAWIDDPADSSRMTDERADPALSAEDVIAQQQEVMILHEAISALPAGAQRALRLYRIDGLGQSEVAQAMGISRSGVEKHLAVAMKHLRSAFTNCGILGSATSGSRDNLRAGEAREEDAI